MSRVVVLTLALAVLVAGARPGGATTPADLCPPAADPCEINANFAITPGSGLLDFGTRAVIVKAGRTLDAGFNALMIKAGSLRLEPGAKLLAAGGVVSVSTEGAIELQTSGTTRAKIDVSDPFGAGAVELITQSGPVVLDGILWAKGTDTEADGGELLVLAGGDITNNGELSAKGGGDAGGGIITLISTGGKVDVLKKTDVTAGSFDGGELDFEALGDVTIAAGADMDVSGGGKGGSGGAVLLVSNEGNITIGGKVLGLAGGTGEDGGGFGGSLDAIAAIGAVALNANVTVPGADGGGGGDGGDVTLIGGTTVTVNANIDSRGGRDTFGGLLGHGGGGLLLFRGCNVTIPAGRTITATGANFGAVLVRASGQATLAGTILATQVVDVTIRNAALPPIVTGVVTPAPVVTVDTGLPPCQACDARNGACCGNGVLDEGEACEDGNTLACDGCTFNCSRVDDVCGDGVIECGEECDPPGPECDANCKVIRTNAAVHIPGEPLNKQGCFIEWAVRNPNAPIVDGFPLHEQECIDGDPSCDADGATNGACDFRVSACIAETDPRLPLCVPAAMKFVNIRRPDPLDPDDATDAANAQRLVDALLPLGLTVRVGSTILQSGVPLTLRDQCTAEFTYRVPRSGALPGERRLSAAAGDVLGHNTKPNRVDLVCRPNPAVCGNGVPELGEDCDDGNADDCDGCSRGCTVTGCGNGIVECDEQCDEGSANGTPGGFCTARCTEAPPALRVPGGKKTNDCTLEWSVAVGTPLTDKRGLPQSRQECVDNDPACDFNPAGGACRFHVWACLGEADPRIACGATAVGAVDLRTPEVGPARTAILAALDEVGFPAGPGERCTRRFDVDVPLGKQAVIRATGLPTAGKVDKDSVKLKCLRP